MKFKSTIVMLLAGIMALFGLSAPAMASTSTVQPARTYISFTSSVHNHTLVMRGNVRSVDPVQGGMSGTVTLLRDYSGHWAMKSTIGPDGSFWLSADLRLFPLSYWHINYSGRPASVGHTKMYPAWSSTTSYEPR